VNAEGVLVEPELAGLAVAATVAAIVKSPEVHARLMDGEEAVSPDIGEAKIPGVSVAEEHGGSILAARNVPHLKALMEKGTVGDWELVALDEGWHIPEGEPV